jgi:hypothetical protein
MGVARNSPICRGQCRAGGGERRAGGIADLILRTQVTLLAAPNIVFPVCSRAFREHKMARSWFIDRNLVLTIASGFALFTLAIADRQARMGAALAT